MQPFDIGSFMYTLDHAESETEELMEQAPVETTNPELMASPSASHQYFLASLVSHYLYFKIDCALSL
jgi:hypothetical protein